MVVALIPSAASSSDRWRHEVQSSVAGPLVPASNPGFQWIAPSFPEAGRREPDRCREQRDRRGRAETLHRRVRRGQYLKSDSWVDVY